MSELADEIIELRNRERADQATFRWLWQQTADLMFPRENQITTKTTPGYDKTRKVYDSTAKLDSQDMASGLSAALIPTGQKFFMLVPHDPALERMDSVISYLSMATEIAHRSIFESNFLLQFNETARSLVVFGTGNLFSEFDMRRGILNFKDYDISFYQILEDSGGNVDTVILTFPLTARQAKQQFGTRLGTTSDVAVAVNDPERRNESFEFVHIVRPRSDRDPRLRDNRNMPWESIIVDVKEQGVVEESGFDEFPFAVARWMKSSGEKWGRGQGTEVLSDVKMLQQMKKDLIDCANKHVRPPYQVLQGHEGKVRTFPDALNVVGTVDAIKALDGALLGNFVINEKAIEQQHAIIHRAFYADVWAMFKELGTGTHRTTMEIVERMREGFRRMGVPASRVQRELLDPSLKRSVLLLIRNGVIPYPPPELQGQDFGIEHIGPMSLALQDEQANGFLRLADLAAGMAEAFPEVADNLASDRGFRRMARAYGAHTDDLATEEEVAAKRQARRAEKEAQEAMQAAQVAGKTYKDASGAPEEGSPSAELMGAAAE